MLYNMDLLNDVEKEILKTEKLIEEKYLKDGNIISNEQLEEIKALPYVSLVLENGQNKYNENLNEYSIFLYHEESELDMESIFVFTK